ncbi:unnamed protein product [Peniophora sp. CBMAI 1063]|nr:unnamed protein product [Peniophora sp. CBMAI 1063]
MLAVSFSQVKGIAEDRVFPLLLETFFIALHAVLTLYIVHRRWVDRKVVPLVHPFLFVILAMFFISSCHWALDVFMLWRDIYKLLPQLGVSTPVLGYLQDQPEALYAQQVLGNILVVFGDGAIQWRAYAIFGRPRWLKRFLIVMFIVEVGLYVVAVLYELLPLFPQAHTSLLLAKSYGRVWIPISSATLAVTGWTYTSSTALIAYKTWRHRKDVRTYAHQYKSQTLVVLAVVVESGVAYTVLWAWYTGINFSSLTRMQAWLDFYSVPLFAMYPAIIIMLVATRRSILDRSTHATGTISEIRYIAPDLHPQSTDESGSTLAASANKRANDNSAPYELSQGIRSTGFDKTMRSEVPVDGMTVVDKGSDVELDEAERGVCKNSMRLT